MPQSWFQKHYPVSFSLTKFIEHDKDSPRFNMSRKYKVWFLNCRTHVLTELHMLMQLTDSFKVLTTFGYLIIMVTSCHPTGAEGRSDVKLHLCKYWCPVTTKGRLKQALIFRRLNDTFGKQSDHCCLACYRLSSRSWNASTSFWESTFSKTLNKEFIAVQGAWFSKHFFMIFSLIFFKKW